MNNDSLAIKVPDHQRALIFQGGGALGAYEVGFYQAVYEKLFREKKRKHPFDIVVGTSIGAINGAILVSYYKKHDSWEGSSEHLKDFWMYLSSTEIFSDTFTEMWHSWRQFFPNAPSKEETRRFLAVREFLSTGVPNVFSTPKLRVDDPHLALGNLWFQSGNEGLKQSLEKFIDFPIATEYEKNEPRLLLVAVDVQESLPVVFDSYKQADGKRKTLYGQTESEDGKAQGGFLIEYDGIEVEHILASASVPISYDFTKIAAKQITGTDPGMGKQVTRYLWDGGVLHNTPMLPLMYAHKRFWDHHIGIEKQRDAVFDGDKNNQAQIPELRIFIVDIWTKKSENVPETLNQNISRYLEIMYSDKTEFEEKVFSVFDDFITISKKLVELAKQKGATKSDLEKILMPHVDTGFYVGVKHSYIDHIRGKFPMKIKRIERSKDPDDVPGQALDFSLKTIEKLFQEGYEDTRKVIEKL